MDLDTLPFPYNDTTYMNAVIRLSRSLGHAELQEVLREHFEEYKDKSGNPMFVAIKQHTRVLARGPVTIDHFRIIMSRVWVHLCVYFECLPLDYKLVDSTVIAMTCVDFTEPDDNYLTFESVVNHAWAIIVHICKTCVGQESSCDIEALADIVMRVQKECEGQSQSCAVKQAATYAPKLKNRKFGRLLGLLALMSTIPVADALKVVSLDSKTALTPNYSGVGVVSTGMYEGAMASAGRLGTTVEDSIASLDAPGHEVDRLQDHAYVVAASKLQTDESKITLEESLQMTHEMLQEETDKDDIRRDIDRELYRFIKHKFQILVFADYDKDTKKYQIRRVRRTAADGTPIDIPEHAFKGSDLWNDLIEDLLVNETDRINSLIDTFSLYQAPEHIVIGHNPTNPSTSNGNVQVLIVPVSSGPDLGSAVLSNKMRQIIHHFDQSYPGASIYSDVDRLPIIHDANMKVDGVPIKHVNFTANPTNDGNSATVSEQSLNPILNGFFNSMSSEIEAINSDTSNAMSILIMLINKDNIMLAQYVSTVAYAQSLYEMIMLEIGTISSNGPMGSIDPGGKNTRLLQSLQNALGNLRSQADYATKEEYDHALQYVIVRMYKYAMHRFVGETIRIANDENERKGNNVRLSIEDLKRTDIQDRLNAIRPGSSESPMYIFAMMSWLRWKKFSDRLTSFDVSWWDLPLEIGVTLYTYPLEWMSAFFSSVSTAAKSLVGISSSNSLTAAIDFFGKLGSITSIDQLNENIPSPEYMLLVTKVWESIDEIEDLSNQAYVMGPFYLLAMYVLAYLSTNPEAKWLWYAPVKGVIEGAKFAYAHPNPRIAMNLLRGRMRENMIAFAERLKHRNELLAIDEEKED